MSGGTFKKYQKTWYDFIAFAGITGSKFPTEEDFMEFLIKRHDEGIGFNSLKSYYSHLNKCVQVLYRYNLEKWPALFGFIKSTSKGYFVKKAQAFEKEELDQFFIEVADKLHDRYIHVRAALGTTYYFGGNRAHELKHNFKWKGKFKKYFLEILFPVCFNFGWNFKLLPFSLSEPKR